jgi:hypothetical protein
VAASRSELAWRSTMGGRQTKRDPAMTPGTHIVRWRRFPSFVPLSTEPRTTLASSVLSRSPHRQHRASALGVPVGTCLQNSRSSVRSNTPIRMRPHPGRRRTHWSWARNMDRKGSRNRPRRWGTDYPRWPRRLRAAVCRWTDTGRLVENWLGSFPPSTMHPDLV